MRSTLSTAVLWTALSAPALAQGFQCDLLGTLNNHGPFNDVWGYVAPNGKEYALLGATTGTVVVDCSNPSTPIERGWFPWANSTWRAIRTYGHYAYVVTEGAGGFMILNLQNPDAPVSLGIFGSAQFGNCHTICIDTGAGRIYCLGTNNGTPVYDVAANPTNPPFLGYALGSGNSNYFHDMQVENGFGYGSMIYNGLLRIWDVSVFPPVALSNTQTPSAFTHNAWPSANGNLSVTTDERVGGLIRLFDTTDKSAPVTLSQFSPNSASIPHNAFIRGNLVHVAWYTEGYQCVDISDPLRPVQVAAWDTWPGASGGFNGAWGCYPFQPSGNIYVSDMSTGLYVVRPRYTDLAIAHTPVADTTNEFSPYVVEADVTSNHAISSVTLRYRVDGGAFQSVPMLPGAVPGRYTGAIPPLNAAVQVEYHIDAVDAQGARRSPRIGEHRFAVGTQVVRWSDGFETELGWTTGGTASDWQRGLTTGRAGNSGGLGWQDPPRSTSGTNVRGNDIGGGTFNGAYAASQDSFLQSPAIPTAGVDGLRLRFRRWLSLAAGDSAALLVNGTTVWASSGAMYDTQWQWIEHDLAAITDPASTVTIRFELVTNSSNAAGGWSLDDVQLFTRHDAASPVSYGAGTPGTGGLVPTVGLSAPALLGTTTYIQGASMLANSVALLVFNLQPADFPALGVQVLVDPTAASLLVEPTSPTGTSSWPFVVPSTPSLDNVWLYAQAMPLDSAGPAGLFAASAGMRFRSCISAP